MRVSRVVFWGCTSLFVTLLLFVLGTSGCKAKLAQRQPGTRIVPCAKEIKVHLADGVVKEHQAVYVCDDAPYNKVTWIPTSGVNSFRVHFPPGDCPFNPCPDITETQATGTVASSLPTELKIYKYTITVNHGPPHDPHVVGGGAY